MLGRCNKRTSLALAAVLAVVVSGQSAALEAKGVKLLAESVEYYDDPSGETVAGHFSQADAGDLELVEESDTLMLLLKRKSGGESGWVYPFLVEIVGAVPGSENASPCDYAFQGQALGERGIGENCKKPD